MANILPLKKIEIYILALPVVYECYGDPASKLALGISEHVFLNFVGKSNISSGLSVFGLLKQNIRD